MALARREPSPGGIGAYVFKLREEKHFYEGFMEQEILQHVKKMDFKPIGKENEDVDVPQDTKFRPLPYKILSVGNKVQEPEEEKKEPPHPVFTEKDLLDSRQGGYEEGYAKGYGTAKSQEAEVAKRINASLDDITVKLAAISEAIKTRNNENIKELAELSLRIAQKVAGTALKNDPYQEIENVVRGCLPLLFDEPEITIFVAPDLVENVKSHITSLAKSEGLKNNIEISGNDTLSFGSCDIKWKCGGIRSDKNELWGRIESMCENLC